MDNEEILANVLEISTAAMKECDDRCQRLLAVARAAKVASLCIHNRNAIEWCPSCHTEEDRVLSEALAAVEDLLDE